MLAGFYFHTLQWLWKILIMVRYVILEWCLDVLAIPLICHYSATSESTYIIQSATYIATWIIFIRPRMFLLSSLALMKAKAQATKIASLVWAEIVNLDRPAERCGVLEVEIGDQAKPPEIHALRDCLDFTFPKIHFLEHFAEQIVSYGYLFFFFFLVT